MVPAMQVQKELMSVPDFNDNEELSFDTERKLITNMKKAILMTAGAAVQSLMNKLQGEQEIIMNIADMLIELFVAEGTLLRVIKISENKSTTDFIEASLMRCYLYDAIDKLAKAGKEAINGFATGDEQRMMLMGLKRFTKVQPYNSKDARRKIADRLIAGNSYCF